jgi:phosphomethylpyrimidine synthase
MNANPTFLAAQAEVDSAAVTPLPNSRKIYVTGSRPDLRVPMREISLSGDNAPVTVYDCSGPYSDPDATIDIRKGLGTPRAAWIAERNDTELLDGPTSDYGRQRLADEKLDALRFELHRQPRRAQAGRNVTQMHYARQGIVTPEMEYVAIRENLRRKEYLAGLRAQGEKGQRMADLLGRQHRGESFGAAFRKKSRRNSCARKSPAAAPSSPPTSTTRNWNR